MGKSWKNKAKFIKSYNQKSFKSSNAFIAFCKTLNALIWRSFDCNNTNFKILTFPILPLKTKF